ncbi:MAG TPA: N-acetylmuramoyl-L-alanine amidase [Luteitalea sp.]|nr:N-acetylmuramoyl-L-alanine amidase [Luteitalea sp.]
MRRSLRIIAIAALTLAVGLPADAQRRRTTTKKKAPVSQVSRTRTAETAYERTLARERSLRSSRRKAPLSQMRAVIEEYELIARKWPRSGYADNALWNGANLAYDANISYGARQERDSAMTMLRWLVREYPSSSLARDAQTRLRKINAAAPKTTKTETRNAKAEPKTPPPAAAELAKANIRTEEAEPAPTEDAADTASPAAPVTAPPKTTAAAPRSTATTPATPAAGAATANAKPSSTDRVTVRDIRRVVLPEVVRVTIELDGEVAYHEEALQNPQRLFFDLRGANLASHIDEGVRAFDDGDVVREIRVGTHPGGVTRVVVDTRGVSRHSLFTLYNPYRLVLDMYREPALTKQMPPSLPTGTGAGQRLPGPLAGSKAPAVASASPATVAAVPVPTAAPETKVADTKAADAPLPATAAAPNVTTAPTAPESNSSGSYSLARQLGLGISRIVIDAGHGGHDPGSLGDGIKEAELVLDVALRLEKLLKQESLVDVVMTRRTDTFIELEERTRIANRQNADLFLSIHANSSRRRTAQGIETFVLNFANNSEAEEVAARENAIAKGSMRQLPDIVKAITLNNKLDESRDLAEMVQGSLVTKLRKTESELPDRGIKQAPLVVLIGASMPSVLAEIGFVSTPDEGSRLKTSKYRQDIAEALRDAVLKYQRSLKGTTTTARTQ